MSWFEGKKKWIAGAAAALGLGIAADQGFRKPIETPVSREAAVLVDTDNDDAAAERNRIENTIRDERAKEKDAEDIVKVKKTIDAMFDKEVVEEKSDGEEAVESADVANKLEQLGKADRIKTFLEKSVPGLKTSMSQDGESLQVAFPNDKGEVDRDSILSLNLTATGTIRIGSVTDFDAPADFPADEGDNLEAIAEAVKAKFKVLAEDNRLAGWKTTDNDVDEKALKDFILQQGLRVK